VPNIYFKRKDGTEYLVSKEEIYKKIDVYNRETFDYLLKELDIPWIPRYWEYEIEYAINHNHPLPTVFTKYYARLWLTAYRPFGYADSERFKDF
jgi:hypothetical protein